MRFPLTLCTVAAIAVSWFGSSAPLYAEDDPTQSAAEAFDEGDAKEALRRYRVVLDTDGPSADLLYNVGIVAWEAGEPGTAIWALEKARLLAPNDDAITDNLAIVRQRVRIQRMEELTQGNLTDGETDDIFWFRLMTAYSPMPLVIVIVVLNVLGFGLLAVRRLMKPSAGRDLVTVSASLCLVTLTLAVAGLFAHAVVVETVTVGVVTDDTGRFYQTPTATAKTKPHPDVYGGAVVRVLEAREDGWTQIRVADGTEGWLKSDDLGRVN